MSWEGENAAKVSNVSEITAMGKQPAAVAELMLTSFGTMMFEHGFVHADPHPGNLLVRRSPHESYLQRITNAIRLFIGLNVSHSPQLIILDHGLYVDIPCDVRRDWCLLWRSLVLGHRQMLNDVSDRLMPSGGGILTAALSFGFVKRCADVFFEKGTWFACQYSASCAADLGIFSSTLRKGGCFEIASRIFPWLIL
jgi:hypothetical protein